MLAGHIRRGSGETMSAVIWSSDLRGFTAFSDHAPGEVVIKTLNDLFDMQARTIAAHGGEILKFVGDGLLAIFPARLAGGARIAARNALAAARETLAELAARPVAAGEAPLRLVIALHFGEVTYGNIGSADRVDFTVIGPAVNLVSRIEAVAKSRDLPLIVSDDFAARLWLLRRTAEPRRRSRCAVWNSRTNCSRRAFRATHGGMEVAGLILPVFAVIVTGWLAARRLCVARPVGRADSFRLQCRDAGAAGRHDRAGAARASSGVAIPDRLRRRFAGLLCLGLPAARVAGPQRHGRRPRCRAGRPR